MKDIRVRNNCRVGFKVRIQPSAPRNELLGWDSAGELRFRIAAPPRGGEANEKLIAYLSKLLGVPQKELAIESGAASKVKLISAPASAYPLLSVLPEVD